mmetsp:Transcript_32500/g.71337  ORF Transcript_32500/g.71337 Transcript_32500/m.71337 type:complete len:614 (-) Transcript_32500:626-2467(-)
MGPLLLLASLLLAAEASRLGEPIVESESIGNESRRLQDKNIVEVAIDAAPEFTTLVDIVGLLDLGDALSGDGPLTVFAPTNQAFDTLLASLPEGGFDFLVESGELMDIVTYHVVPKAIKSTDLPLLAAAGEVTAPTLEGSLIEITGLSPPKIDGVEVVEADIMASNGIIHAMGGVLIPESSSLSKTVVELASESSDFSTLVSIVTDLGLVDALSAPGSFTIFAPTDQAFEDLLSTFPADGPGSLQDLIDTGVLEEIVKYHVLDAAILSSSISDGNKAKTLQGNLVTATVDASGVKINDANVVVADVLGSNGVIHGIDKVIMPPTPTQDIVDIASAQFPTLASLISELGLVETLSGSGPFDQGFTVFSPTDSAFSFFLSRLPPGGLEFIKSSGDLEQVLLYHVLGGTSFSTDLVPFEPIETLQGDTLKETKVDPVMVINYGSKIDEADILATNGVLHAVEKVLLPRSLDLSKNLLEILCDREDLSELKDLVLFLDLAQPLFSARPLTIFAPTNDAFEALYDSLPESGTGSLEDLRTSGVLKDIVMYHVVSGDAFLASVLTDGASATTLQGEDVTISISDDAVTINDDSTVVQADIIGANGVLHYIDTVLLPPSL